MKGRVLKIYSILVLMLFIVSETSYALSTINSSNSIAKGTWMENRNPNPPEITGPTSGEINTIYPYNFLLTDPDGDPLKAIQIEWGGLGSDNTTYICWICDGSPKPNGTIFEYSHIWKKTGTYTIRAKIWDLQGNESDWGTLSVTMPYSYNILFMTILERFFELFPHAFPILRHLMGY